VLLIINNKDSTLALSITPLPIMCFTKNTRILLYPIVHMSRQIKILLTLSVIYLCIFHSQERKENSHVSTWYLHEKITSAADLVEDGISGKKKGMYIKSLFQQDLLKGCGCISVNIRLIYAKF